MAIDTLRGKIVDLTRIHDNDAQVSAYTRAAALGFVGGLRSMTPLALLSQLRSEGEDASSSNLIGYLNSPAARIITGLLAVGELVGDKLPATPSRLAPAPLAGRIVIGALAGWVLCQQSEQSPLLGALLGAAGAASGSAAGYYARAWLDKVTKWPDPIVGIVEDLVTLGLGYLITRETD
ncbi:MAG: DUF4126 family protein [Ktedonobacteraceae bacterium]